MKKWLRRGGEQQQQQKMIKYHLYNVVDRYGHFVVVIKKKVGKSIR